MRDVLIVSAVVLVAGSVLAAVLLALRPTGDGAPVAQREAPAGVDKRQVAGGLAGGALGAAASYVAVGPGAGEVLGATVGVPFGALVGAALASSFG